MFLSHVPNVSLIMAILARPMVQTHPDEPLFTALAVAVERQLSEFNQQARLPLQWPYMCPEHPDEKALENLIYDPPFGHTAAKQFKA